MSTYVTYTISYEKYETPIDRCIWQPDSVTSICNVCQNTIKSTSIFKSNKHHCRFCGKIICNLCSQNRSNKYRICDLCFEEKLQLKSIIMSKKLELKNALIKLSSCLPPHFKTRIPNPIKISPNKFLFLSSKRANSCNDDSLVVLYCYNALKNKWSVQATFKKKECLSMHQNSFAFNPETNEIFGINCSNNQQKLIKINLINNSIEIIDLTSILHNLYVYKLDRPSCTFINNQYHIIGGKNSNKHYILDNKTNIPIFKWTFDDSMLKDPGLIYLESKQILYSFGGVTNIYNNGYTQDQSNYIYKCVPSANHKLLWRKLNVKMPYEASNFGIVSCKHDKYILLFNTGQRRYRRDIFIFDVEKEIFTKSLVECPVSTVFNIETFIPTDFSYKMNILLCGYFHLNTERSCEFLPQDIINLVIIFNGTDSDFIHILSHNAHWKLNIDYILNNTEKIKDKSPINLASFKFHNNLW
eukprot:100428_1